MKTESIFPNNVEVKIQVRKVGTVSVEQEKRINSIVGVGMIAPPTHQQVVELDLNAHGHSQSLI